MNWYDNIPHKYKSLLLSIDTIDISYHHRFNIYKKYKTGECYNDLETFIYVSNVYVNNVALCSLSK